MRHIVTTVIIFFCIGFVNGQGKPGKSRYTLLNPVPGDKMKDMETDRPDVTESPYSVEAGHFQVESDLFKQVRNRNTEFLNVQNIYNLANFKLGLTEKMDIQVVFPIYVNNTTRIISTNKIIDQTGGFDDITFRFKYNIWGSEGGKTALAVLPFLSIPTSSFSNNGVQGGVIFPYAIHLKKELTLGTQFEVDLVKEDNNRYYTNFLYSCTLGNSLFKNVDGFAEAFTTYSSYTKNIDVFLNGGITYSINKNFNLDAGFNVGLTTGSDKILFTGFSFRL